MATGDKIIYFVDATCDIPADLIAKHNIQVIGLRYSIGNEDGMYTVIDKKSLTDFYAKMRKGQVAKTSLVTYDDAYAAFEPFFKDGYDIIHLGLSSGLAKTYENEFNAGTDLAKKYGRRFFAPDTRLVTIAHVLILEKMFEIGNFDRIVAEIKDYYEKVVVYFSVESLTYLHRGGRLSAGAAIMGGMLNIKPIIRVNPENGKLESISKVKGRPKSMATLADFVKDLDPADQKVAVVHGDCLEDARTLAEKVKAVCPSAEITIYDLGLIIGTHAGPGTIGLGFKTK